MASWRSIRLLADAAHPGPTAVVTSLAALLGYRSGVRRGRLLTLVGAVLTGQLTIGWSNDLIDRRRDELAGRRDKPLATGELSPRAATAALGIATAATAGLSGRCGRRAGFVHGVLVVGSGWIYNVWLKQTPASFAPYAVAFGALPQVATLSAVPSRVERSSLSLAGALLGVGAHLLNALPDLETDRLTGVRGLPSRMTSPQLRAGAATCLFAAAPAALRGAPVGGRDRAGWLIGSGLLGAGIALGRGAVPFYCAAGSALLDAAALVRSSPLPG